VGFFFRNLTTTNRPLGSFIVVIYDNNVREHIENKIIITEGTNKNTEFLSKTAKTQ
jgi:hypothetical protein